MKLNLFFKILNYCEDSKSEKYVRVFANKLCIKIYAIYTFVDRDTLYVCVI